MALSYLPCLIGQVQPQIDEDPVLGGLRAASSKEGRIELANGGDSKRRQRPDDQLIMVAKEIDFGKIKRMIRKINAPLAKLLEGELLVPAAKQGK
jgi:hypothetical protein